MKTWNQRAKHYMAIIDSGDREAILGIVQELQGLREIKVLSFGERKLLQLAEEILGARQVMHLRVLQGGAR